MSKSGKRTLLQAPLDRLMIAADAEASDTLFARSRGFAAACSSQAAVHTSRAASAFMVVIPRPTIRSGHADRQAGPPSTAVRRELQRRAPPADPRGRGCLRRGLPDALSGPTMISVAVPPTQLRRPLFSFMEPRPGTHLAGFFLSASKPRWPLPRSSDLHVQSLPRRETGGVFLSVWKTRACI